MNLEKILVFCSAKYIILVNSEWLSEELAIFVDPEDENSERLWNIGDHSFIPLARAERDDSLPFSGASSIPVCYVLFPATLLHQLFFHPLTPHLAIYFLFYLSVLFPDSYINPFGNSVFFRSLYMPKPT